MLSACFMCDERLDPVVWPGYKLVCPHTYCHSCYAFLVRMRFPCVLQCRDSARTCQDDGKLIKMTVVRTSEGDDEGTVKE